MKKIFSFPIFLAFISSFLFISYSFADSSSSPSNIRIAVIDINRIIDEHPVSIAWDQELAAIRAQRENSVRDQILAKYGISNESQLSDSQKSEVQRFVFEENEKFRQEMLPKRDERLKIVEADIIEFSALLAKNDNYFLVLEKNAVIFGGEEVTDKVLSMINEKHKK